MSGSFPAARLGDVTAHGGIIVSGYPTVLIGQQPAARITDMHICPMVNGIIHMSVDLCYHPRRSRC